MSQDRFTVIRTTQRVPRSCTSCTSRKVRCDKSIPCGTCVRRGHAETCVREMVIFRGEMTTYRDASPVPTYQDLKSENAQLRRELEVLKAQNSQLQSGLPGLERPGGVAHRVSSQPPRMQWIDQDVDGLEQKLWDRLASDLPASRSVVSSWGDIVLPSQSCSERLLDYDERWNSWVHYALEYPQFRHECDGFTSTMADGATLDQADPFWMAVYFSVLSAALLMMDDDEAEEMTLQEPFGHQMLSQIWYDAAIFCLHRADFMRVPHIRSVQAIAVLGICFNNFGNSDLGQHMWSCALRIAQRIHLDTPYSQLAAKHLSKEAQHRLWWTLVICEWLSLPYHPPAFDEIDFDVPYPTAPSPSTSDVTRSQDHPVHYHIFMARTATVWHRFLRAVRIGLTTLDETIRVIRATDEELAAIIDTLPLHLQPDMHAGNEEEHAPHATKAASWVTWQRFDLTLVLLHLRVRVNRALQDQWLSTSKQQRPDWARTITVRSSVSIIWIKQQLESAVFNAKAVVSPPLYQCVDALGNLVGNAECYRALSYQIFTAALVLLREIQDREAGHDEGYCEVVHTAIELLDQVKSRNALAYHASIILQERLASLEKS